MFLVESPPAAGPRSISQLVEVAIGAYTEIVDVIAPAQAAPGELVAVEVRVKNTWDSVFYISVTGHYDGLDIFPTEDYAIVDPGVTHSFYFSFTMPGNDIKLQIWSFYWTVEGWFQDDYSYVDIILIPEEEEVAPVSLWPLAIVGLGVAALTLGVVVAVRGGSS